MNMENKIVVVGAGDMANVEAALIAAGHEGITVVSPAEAKLMPYVQHSAPFIFENIYPIDLYQGKQFVCKGKHEYREIKTECGDRYWICQCGRKL